MNIAHNIEQASRLFPDKTAVKFEERTYSFHQLNQLVNQFAHALHSLDVQRGDRVALFLPNIPEFIITYLACQKMGAIAVSMNVMLKKDGAYFILDDSQAKVVVTVADLVKQIDTNTLPHLQHIIVAEGEHAGALPMYQLMSTATDQYQAIQMEPTDPAAIVYTSGTTGFPKGAVLSHGNVVSNAYSKIHYTGMNPDDNILLFLPLFHCFGQNAILNSAMLACATIILQRRFIPEVVLPTLIEEQISMFFAVPTIYIRLLNTAVPPEQFATVRYFFSAAATLPEEIARRWYDVYGRYIYIGYGLTETSPFASYNNSLKYKFGSIGTPIENVEMRIVDTDTGQPLPPGQPGEIVIRGCNIMLGYWNQPQITANALQDGWFHSGDIGQMDEDGYFYIVDRLKDMINVSGFKVYPAEVENVLYQLPQIAETAVYGIPDEMSGETVRALVVLKESHTVAAEEIINFCRHRLAAYQVPQRIHFVPELPKSATGKILKRIIQQEESNRSWL